MNRPEHRILLEQNILGACLLENAYQAVVDILEPKNFLPADADRGTYFCHQKIYAAIKSLYPARPIEVTTVRRELPKEYSVYLVELTNKVHSAANLRYHAFVLLEYNVRGSFIDLLHREQSSGKYNVSTKQALQEVIDECLDSANDIFEIISATKVHLKNILADEPLIKAVTDFETMIDRRILSIKRQASIDCLVNNLTSLNRLTYDTTTQMAVSHLTDVLKNILATGRVDQKLANTIFSLKVG